MKHNILLQIFLFCIINYHAWATVVDSSEYAFDETMPTVVVSAKRKLPPRRNNPAIPIIKRAIAQKPNNRLTHYANWSYRMYRRTLLSFAEREHEHVLPFADTTAQIRVHNSLFAGYRQLPVSLREEERIRASRSYSILPEMTIGRRIEGIDEEFDEGLLTATLNKMFASIDPYEANIDLFDREMPGPLSTVAVLGYYRFLLADTVEHAGSVCYSIQFSPNNCYDPGIEGKMLLDTTTLAITYFEGSVPENSTVNMTESNQFQIRYSHTSESQPSLWLPQQMTLSFMLTPLEGIPVHLQAEVVEHYRNFEFGEAALQSERLDPSLSLPIAERRRLSALRTGNRFGLLERPIALTPLAVQNSIMMDLLRKKKNYRSAVWWGQFASRGFIGVPIGGRRFEDSYVLLGPIDALLSGNPIEGFRMKVGGMTLAKLNPHWFASGYIAYGFKDRRPKYMLNLAYSFTPKHTYKWDYPMSLLSIEAYSDLFIPGNTSAPLYKDRLDYTLNNLGVRNRYYEQLLRLSYEKDFSRNLCAGFSVAWKRRRAVGTTIYWQDGGPMTGWIRQGVLSLFAEYHRNRTLERGVWGNKLLFDPMATNPRYRINIDLFPKGFNGNLFTNCSIDLLHTRRIPLSFAGFVNMSLALGWKWGTTHEFDLFTPEANGSFMMGKESKYQLLKPNELVADRRLAFSFAWHAPGLLLNRIPYVNRLRLKEVLALSGYWGNASSSQNVPGRVSGTARPMHNFCYLEMGAGIENIFQLFSCQYFVQLTPTDSNGKPRMGIRIGFTY